MLTSLQVATFEHFGTGKEAYSEARRFAGKLFDRVHGHGVRGQWLAKLGWKKNCLRTLSSPPEVTQRTTETVVVSMNRIVGTENRSEDFDANFNPLKTHNRERWISVAAARRTGVVLPAVELVQNGDVYFVRDGHHRISVARAMGQLEIEARLVA